MERKRSGPWDEEYGDSGFKKSKQEMDSGSKLKPCTKFFSPSGCPFGENCHFLHYVQGGLHAVTLMLGKNPALPTVPKAAQPGHGPARFSGSYMDPPTQPSMGSAAGFGASASAKIRIDAALAGLVIGKGGAHSKRIYQLTGAKLKVRDHESDPNSRNIELEGTLDQVKRASEMVHELILSVGSGSGSGSGSSMGGQPPSGRQARYGPASSSYKTKVCANFAKGSCTFGGSCHFAHGAEELRRPEM